MAEGEDSLFLSEGEGENNDEQQVSGQGSAPAPINFFDEWIEEEENRAYENTLFYKPSEEKPNLDPGADNFLKHTQVSNAPYVSPYADDGAEAGYGRMTVEKRGASLRYGDSTYGQKDKSPRRPAPFSGEPGYEILPPTQRPIHPLPARSTWRQEYTDPENPNPTVVCGIVTPEKLPPLNKPDEENKSSACGRCLQLFVMRSSIRRHFPSCVRKHGNPKGLRWVDTVDFTPDPPPRVMQAPAPIPVADTLLADNIALQRRVNDLEATTKSNDLLLAENKLLRRRMDELESIGQWDKPAFQRLDFHWAVRGVQIHPDEAVVEEVKQLVKNGKPLAEGTGEEWDGTRDGQPDPKRRRV
ncbi:MAG: hypothetical protein Q9208_005166 [Pyrenodesmia sp. 3 TL-2023]